MVSHYGCEKQHNLRKLNVKHCTEALSNIQQANFNAIVYLRAKPKRNKAYKF